MIKVENLTKYYGDFPAVDGLSFEIEEGHVYGFLGPNGAGKSTTMNIITGCLSATEGTVTVGGYDILEEPEAAKRLIGYLPEQPPLYTNETPFEYLQFVGEAKGLKKKELKEQIEAVVEQTGLETVQHQLISTLSKGYKQRVGIAQALLGDPKLIILDEPTVGLDPIQIIEIRDLIKALGEKHTVIFSSHILSEVQAICEKVLIISHGKLVAFDTPEGLETMASQSNGLYVKAEADEEAVRSVLEKLENVEAWETEDMENGAVQVRISCAAEDARALGCRIFRAFAAADLPIFGMTVKKASLEDVFIELTEQDGDEGLPEDEGDFFSPDTEQDGEDGSPRELTEKEGDKA